MKNLRSLKSVKSAQPSFALNFSVNTENNGDLSPVIYIENIENAHDLNWEIKNEGVEELYITANPTKASSTNYHFQLKFRPGTLSDNFIHKPLNIKIPNSEGVTWDKIVYKDDTSKLVYISILAYDIVEKNGKKEFPLNPAQPLKIEIESVNADPVGGARNTNVEFLFQDILNSTNPENKLKGNRMQHLGVVNHQGVRSIPLIIETIGNATILNTEVDNDLMVQISNYSNKNIPFSTDPNNATQFELIIYFPMDNESGSVFLASKEDLNHISFDWKNKADWTVSDRTETPDAFVWMVTNHKQNLLLPGDSIDFDLNHVRTNLPEGTAKIQINYFNIPGFWDGTLYLDITKSPIDFKNKFVGIHTNNPKCVLDVRDGSVNIQDQGNNAVFYGPQLDGTGGFYFRKGDSSGSSDLMTISNSSQVTAKEFNDGTGNIMPKGAIILWSGAENAIPTGWALCDGKNNTPNLIGRFLVCAGSNSQDIAAPEHYNVNDKGGFDYINLSIDNLPPHSHKGKTTENGAHYHEMNFYDSGRGNSVPTTDHDDASMTTHPTSWNGNHTHDLKIENTGGGQSFDNRPSYYALCYIMKL